ncbi:MAG: prolipoprotein diacylglyceryl transferase [Planctomycetes bacterium]|nr:prolipoprotein diacylglyceryl transferase [Planctomycetota bacterium]
MRQVLFEIPLSSLNANLPDIPIYGYGFMLFLAFVFCTWLAIRLARREGIPAHLLQDLAVWIFVSGIIGARATYVIQDVLVEERHRFTSVSQVFALWDGGLVFYGSAIGAVVGFFSVYFIYFKKYHISNWKLADIIAPCVALGLALGRVGCLLNGCCYGNVACADCPAIHFPYSANPVYTMVERGYQTPAGFTIQSPANVTAVAPGSPAERAGLMPGDRIVGVGSHEIASFMDLETYLRDRWPRGVNEVQLTVRDADGTERTLAPFRPESLGLHPTQLYETISMALLLFLLLSYYPFKKRDGSVMVLFMVGYGVHRFLNEMLRTDTKPVAFGMTLSQNISILVLTAATALALIIWARNRTASAPPQPIGQN